ncbi:MAG: hypothetical protein ABI867_10895 [Kofleriaceae bacterium]
MCDANQHAIDLGNKLETKTFTLPTRSFFKLDLRDCFDSEDLQGFREQIDSTVARARAIESSRE